MTDKPQPQVVECYALRGDNGSFLFNQALRTEDDARAQRSQNIQFAVSLKVEPTQWEIIPSILVPRAEYERLQSEIEAANARIAAQREWIDEANDHLDREVYSDTYRRLRTKATELLKRSTTRNPMTSAQNRCFGLRCGYMKATSTGARKVNREPGKRIRCDQFLPSYGETVLISVKSNGEGPSAHFFAMRELIEGGWIKSTNTDDPNDGWEKVPDSWKWKIQPYGFRKGLIPYWSDLSFHEDCQDTFEPEEVQEWRTLPEYP